MDFSLKAVSGLNWKDIAGCKRALERLSDLIARVWPFSGITENHLLHFTVFEIISKLGF